MQVPEMLRPKEPTQPRPYWHKTARKREKRRRQQKSVSRISLGGKRTLATELDYRQPAKVYTPWRRSC